MKVSPNEKGQSVRLLRIGEQVRHALAQVLLRGDLRDELLTNTIVSVSEVRVTADMRIATAYVKPLGDADEQAVIKALASHAKYLRGEIARQLATKYTPELRFRRDESFDAGARIDAILKRPGIARDLPPAAHVTTIAELEEEDRLLGPDHDDEAEDAAPDALATDTPATGAGKA